VDQSLPFEITQLKRCAICKALLPKTEFNVNRGRRDGLQSHCRECNRARSKAYYARNPEKHRAVVAERKQRVRSEHQARMLDYLREHACADCGEDDLLVLEFDHLRDKQANISYLVHHGKSWPVVLDEIAKCEVVCANCHRRRTHRRQGTYRVSGEG
jgi:5-methylcytosine-specific restriction endonuclease McrA